MQCLWYADTVDIYFIHVAYLLRLIAVAAKECVFDRTLTQCVPAPSGTLNSAQFLTSVAQCKTIGQVLAVSYFLPTDYLLSYISAPSQMKPSDNLKADVQKEFDRMRDHIFQGEPGKPTSGRHTLSAWTQANRDAGLCDNQTHICAFGVCYQNPSHSHPHPSQPWHRLLHCEPFNTDQDCLGRSPRYVY